MTKERKVIYYKDETNDDFAQLGIKRKPLGEKFEYVHKNMQDKLPAIIIVLTDGHDIFPEESITKGIPVLWLLNNDEVIPPWGKVARITV